MVDRSQEKFLFPQTLRCYNLVPNWSNSLSFGCCVVSLLSAALNWIMSKLFFIPIITKYAENYCLAISTHVSFNAHVPAFNLKDATYLDGWESCCSFFLMSELKMKIKAGGFVCAVLDQCNGLFNRQSLDMKLLFYLGFVFNFSFF